MKSAALLGKRPRHSEDHNSGDDDSTNVNNSSGANESQLHISEPTSDSEGCNDQKKQQNPSPNSLKRKTMEVVKCPHKNQKHYAKGMCNHCYHKFGRNSNADACPHTDRLVYAKGKCQNCYLNDYNKLKRKLKKDKAPMDAVDQFDGSITSKRPKVSEAASAMTNEFL